MAQSSADQTAGLKCECVMPLEQPLLFVATLTPIFNKTLGLGHVGITNKHNSQPFAIL